MAKEGLEPPLIGMQFDLTLPVISADSLFDRDHSFGQNCSANDTSVDCRINVFTKLSQGNNHLNDFSVLLPANFGDDFDWSYSYRMHEWTDDYQSSPILDLKNTSPLSLMRGIGGFPFPKRQTNTNLSQAFIDASEGGPPRLVSYALIKTSLLPTNQLVQAISLTFENGVTEETIIIEPSSDQDLTSLLEKPRTTLEGHVHSFSQEILTDLTYNVPSGLWSISFNGQVEEDEAPFDDSIGQEKTTGIKE